ncbi:MAG: hypothetical protein ACKPJD_10375 [Planctomycetaceae bacterium]|jgi:hypothetical protein
MSQMFHGKAQGRMILLDEPLQLDFNEEVEVVVRRATRDRSWGEGIRNSAGAMSQTWSEEDDRILAEIQADRKQCDRPEPSE